MRAVMMMMNLRGVRETRYTWVYLDGDYDGSTP
jgi:hypothetical protein